MFATLKSLFKPLQFEDEEQTRIANVLNAIMLASLTFFPLFLLLPLFGVPLVGSTYIIAIPLISVFLVLLVVLRRGHVKVASIVLLSVGWLALSTQAWHTGGVHGTAFFANVLVILAAILLVGTWLGAVFTVLAIGSGWFFAYAANVGLLTPYLASDSLAALEMTLMFGLTAVLTQLLMNNLGSALKNIRSSNQQLQRLSSHLEAEVAERTRYAEAARQEAEDAREAMATQMWLATGQAQLSDKMRGEQAISSLANNVIGQLCHYLEVPMGALFVREGAYLRLQGGYAYEWAQEVVFRLGEGPVGEAARQQQTLMLREVPHDYVTIGSSLGEKRPCYLLLQPLVYDGEVLGVIELGAWHAFTEQTQQFLRSTNEGIAVAIRTAQDRARIDELLSQMKAQDLAL